MSTRTEFGTTRGPYFKDSWWDICAYLSICRGVDVAMLAAATAKRAAAREAVARDAAEARAARKAASERDHHDRQRKKGGRRGQRVDDDETIEGASANQGGGGGTGTDGADGADSASAAGRWCCQRIRFVVVINRLARCVCCRRRLLPSRLGSLGKF